MALVYPLALSGFMDLLRVQEVRLDLDRPLQMNSLHGGELLTAEVAPPYWRGSIALAPMASRAADEVLTLLAALSVPGRAFEVCHPHRIGPAGDPLGAALSGFAPVIEAVPSNAFSLRLGGLPQGYALSPGDMISFDYDPGTGTRRALHRVVEDRAATTLSAFSGYRTGEFEVVPYVRPGAAAGAAVRLVRPACLGVLVPGSVSSGSTRGSVTSGVAFSWRQKLRA
ncbi:hypothetical protein KUV26_03665 [Leisingera daeponensis]|uniref:Uncharacterized protein n=1 Tax=Leisingera daeponensis TaxID=405746 RepID=A0ABS7NBE5_9RHOB|nr:hypothetical protein [Leisingera daeponensis]MBY6138523.1 hypothetical protein [Leisingera daeponensis]